MRGAPQRGLARAMVRTSLAISESTGGRPVRPRRDFQLQKRAEALSVPANHGLRLNDMERFAPPCPPLGEPHPEDAVEEADPRSLGAAAEQGELLSQRQVLKNEVGAGLQRSAQSAQQSEYEGHCYAGSLDRRPTSSVATDILANDNQEMFRRIERMIGARMPEGYHFVPNPDEVAKAVLGASTWAVLALTCHIELFVQAHYVESIQPDSSVSPLYKDVFLFHWKDESQHTMLDELEWTRVDRRLTLAERDRAVDDFIALVGSVDGILQAQAAADVSYFQKIAEGRFDAAQVAQLGDLVLRAYRWQYIVSGAQHPRFAALGHDGSAPGSA